MPDIEIKTRAQVMRPGKKGLLRFDPWSHYVEPLIRGAYWLQKHRKEAVFRVYLAADMRFLVPDLVAAGCEVFLMKSNSLAHNPGAMWRFLAFEDAGNGRMVTVVDADRAGKPETDMAQTEEATRLGLGWWRVPVWGELNEVGNVSYRPILGCQFGGNQMLPTKLLMQALIWNTQKGKIDPMAKLPGCKPARVHGSLWPDYGFDEWFLLTSVYPRAAFDGLLTFVPAEAKSRLLPLDIEYAQWANAKSEMVYFGKAGGGCCGGNNNCDTPSKEQAEPVTANEVPADVIAYIYKPDCGLGEAAAANIQAMRELGLTVRSHYWNGSSNWLDSGVKDPKQVYYHHWHPQPNDKARVWTKEFFGKAYHIAFWACETDTMPVEFSGVAKGMKEIWVPSHYCLPTFSVTGKAVHVVPHAVPMESGGLDDLPCLQADSGGVITVLFLFDGWSRMARKNPEAAIQVFKQAFPKGTPARLIIKAHHLSPDELSRLQKLCGMDHWITILNHYFTEKELNSIYRSADILLSLQRSEGFGLNLAKALAHGIPVITTGCGGHLDFCDKREVKLVPYKLEEAASYGDPWYACGMWGAPDEKEAVKLLKKLAQEIKENPVAVRRRRAAAQRRVQKGFSPAALKERVRELLQPRFPKRVL
jgi:glycosyltransferase involved in cell wall biosynthesis